MTLRLYNTLTRSVEPFAPLSPPRVGVYVCGPTVYDVPHLGHVRSAYSFDVLRRALESRGFQVLFVRNVTDVDDKIIERAREETGAGGEGQGARDLKTACRQISERYLEAYHNTLAQLGIGSPTHEPRATEHVVPDMTDCIAQLLINGAAYEAGGDVYFAVRKFPGYGRLSNRTVDELQVGARVESGERKRDPLDFALWKAAKPQEPSWSSPWGLGRPGWHIECSAMSAKLLGDAFDIHGGGVDLVFPHHENEIAQAQTLGKPFARWWIHNGLLTVNGEKMSKSLGNWISVEDVLRAYPHPDYLKLFFLKTHYRSPIDYSTEKMAEAKKNWEEFSRFFQHYDQRKADSGPAGAAAAEAVTARGVFDQAMGDDLNTPQALAVLFDLVNAGHRLLESNAPEGRVGARSVCEVLVECGGVLGLFRQGVSEEPLEVQQQVQARIRERDAARQAKHFARADEIREALRRDGYLLTDTAGGTLWRRAG